LNLKKDNEIFYAPGILNGKTVLDVAQSNHCIKVLRHRAGDDINVVDGEGGFYTAKISSADAKQCLFEIESKTENFGKRDFQVHIAIAPTKNTDRFEWFLEKATEIGIDEITPLICEHSERRKINNERCEKILITAMKQSHRAYLPKLNKLTPFKNFTSTLFTSSHLFICHWGEENGDLKNAYQKGTDAVILIGPEGDFSENEISHAIEKQFIVVNLGTNRLRTETAGIVACDAIHFVND
jgi:16S rRNA (uracil1498-N3)-methyltransferase